MTAEEPAKKLSISPNSPAPPVPAFGCVVYVRRGANGVHARVANLAGIEATASDERGALAKIVPAFKERITQLMQSGEEIPWIDPPAAKDAEEQKRFLPVHL